MEQHTRNAAGFILASIREGRRVFLLLRNARHGAWGFPKGHAERGEAALQTARRETREETGITELTVVNDFEWRDEYLVRHPKRGEYRKRITYFLATTPKAAHIQSREHSESAWFELGDALAKLQFDSLRQALRAADERLNRA